MRPSWGPALVCSILAATAFAVPAAASAALPIDAGDYRGVTGDVEVRFTVASDGGVHVENFEMFNARCGKTCDFYLRTPYASIDGRTLEFLAAPTDVAVRAEMPLTRVKLTWTENGFNANGTWTTLRNEGEAWLDERVLPISVHRYEMGNNVGPAPPPKNEKGPQGASAGDGPLAALAATRPEYVGMLDPICRSYEKPAVGLLKTFAAQTKGALKAKDAARMEQKLLGPFGRLIGGANKLVGRLTTQIAGVPPATGDEAAVATWLEGRRAYRRTSDRAVRAGKKRDVTMLFKLLGKAAGRFADGEKAVASFGFQSCIG